MGELLIGAAFASIVGASGSMWSLFKDHNVIPLICTAASSGLFVLMLRRYDKAQTKVDKARAIPLGLGGTLVLGCSFFAGMPIAASILAGGLGSAYFALCMALSANVQ
jgi:hypothetical protein